MPLMRMGMLAGVALIGGATIAAAADLRPAYKAPPPAPPAPVQDWSGIYVGLEGGYGWGHQTFDPAFTPDFNEAADINQWILLDFGNPSLNSVHQSGWLFGGFVGAQKQWGNWVIGIEADFDGANIKGSATSSISSPSIACVLGTRDDCSVTRSLSIDSKIDELGSVRSKSGWAFAPNWLVYYTSGIAFAHVKETVNLTQTTNYDLQTYTGTATASGGLSMLGWALGAGLDWKWPVDAGSAWVLGIEYVHYQFSSDTLTIADNQFGSGSSLGISTRQSVDTVKARISYFFSIH